MIGNSDSKRKHLSTAKRWAVLAGWCAALATAACSSDEPKKEPSSFALPDTSSQFDSDNTFPVNDTLTAEDIQRLPDLGEDDGALSDAGTDAAPIEDSDGGASDDLGGPETTPVITSCASHCGIYLEDNPCHCSVLCQSEGSCCDDFIAMCKCANDQDCDDSNDCTSDSCNKTQGICFQQPLKSCCLSDAECSGGDACNTPKCLTGTCTLQPKDCDDGIACTADYCSKGECVNKVQTTQCLVDGACYKAGDQQPDSGGCATCDPAKLQTNWTAKAGMCSVDGSCVPTGTAKDGAACAVCDTTKSATSWSVKSGSCLIDGTCYKSGEANPASACEICDPTSSATAWSGKSGFCAIDGQCIAAGTADPSNACQTCDPAKSKTGWSAATGKCLIDGKCISSGAVLAGSGGCMVCDTKSPNQWTPKSSGTTCSLGGCVSNAKCDGTGTCAGVQKPGCCIKDEDCDASPIVPKTVCEAKACDIISGYCVIKGIAGCCTTGNCCDVATNTLAPAGTLCGAPTSGAEYKCEGNASYKRDVYSAACTGSHASQCSSSVKGYGEWTLVKDCLDKTCYQSSSTATPVCK